MSRDDTTSREAIGENELEAQELEELEAPGWDAFLSAALSLSAGVSIGVAIT